MTEPVQLEVPSWEEVRPLHDYVLMAYEPSPRFSEGGIQLPEGLLDRQGRVIRVGPEVGDDLHPGDLIVYCLYGGTEVVTQGGMLLRLLRRDDIEAVVEFDNPGEDPQESFVRVLRGES